MPVFKPSSGQLKQLTPQPFSNEKELQRFIEANLEELLGIRLVATEFSTGEQHGGRIDTLGLDEAGNPTVIEYKFTKSDSVINQGLYYLAWLRDHHGDYELAAQRALGGDVKVSWDGPRLILIASTYTKFDSYAVGEFGLPIQLMRYQRYEDGTFVLEAISERLSTQNKPPKVQPNDVEPPKYDLDHHRAKTGEEQWAAFLELRELLLALDGVEERSNQKVQITYRTTKSFAAIVFNKGFIGCQFKGGENIDDPQGKAKDIRSHGWGYQWISSVKSTADVEYAFGLLKAAYEFEQ